MNMPYNPKWEYKLIAIKVTGIFDYKLIKEFNTLGKDGWELVSYDLVPIHSSLTAIQDELKGVTYVNCICIFKRKIKENGNSERRTN